MAQRPVVDWGEHPDHGRHRRACPTTSSRRFANARSAGAVELPPPPGLRPGDRVKVLTGPFEGQLALYAGMKPHERVEVLLSLFGAQQRVSLARDAIAAHDTGVGRR